MPASTGKNGLGATLELSDGESPGTLVAIANVVSMEVGGVSLNLLDATHLGSENFYGEFLPALKTSQPWTASLQFDPTHATQDGATGLRQRLEDRELTTLRVNLTALGITTGFEADGYVQELGNISFGAQAIMTQNFTFQPTGRVRVVTIS